MPVPPALLQGARILDAPALAPVRAAVLRADPPAVTLGRRGARVLLTNTGPATVRARVALTGEGVAVTGDPCLSLVAGEGRRLGLKLDGRPVSAGCALLVSWQTREARGCTRVPIALEQHAAPEVSVAPCASRGRVVDLPLLGGQAIWYELPLHVCCAGGTARVRLAGVCPGDWGENTPLLDALAGTLREGEEQITRLYVPPFVRQAPGALCVECTVEDANSLAPPVPQTSAHALGIAVRECAVALDVAGRTCGTQTSGGVVDRRFDVDFIGAQETAGGVAARFTLRVRGPAAVLVLRPRQLSPGMLRGWEDAEVPADAAVSVEQMGDQGRAVVCTRGACTYIIEDIGTYNYGAESGLAEERAYAVRLAAESVGPLPLACIEDMLRNAMQHGHIACADDAFGLTAARTGRARITALPPVDVYATALRYNGVLQRYYDAGSDALLAEVVDLLHAHVLDGDKTDVRHLFRVVAACPAGARGCGPDTRAYMGPFDEAGLVRRERLRRGALVVPHIEQPADAPEAAPAAVQEPSAETPQVSTGPETPPGETSELCFDEFGVGGAAYTVEGLRELFSPLARGSPIHLVVHAGAGYKSRTRGMSTGPEPSRDDARRPPLVVLPSHAYFDGCERRLRFHNASDRRLRVDVALQDVELVPGVQPDGLANDAAIAAILSSTRTDDRLARLWALPVVWPVCEAVLPTGPSVPQLAVRPAVSRGGRATDGAPVQCGDHGVLSSTAGLSVQPPLLDLAPGGDGDVRVCCAGQRAEGAAPCLDPTVRVCMLTLTDAEGRWQTACLLQERVLAPRVEHSFKTKDGRGTLRLRNTGRASAKVGIDVRGTTTAHELVGGTAETVDITRELAGARGFRLFLLDQRGAPAVQIGAYETP